MKTIWSAFLFFTVFTTSNFAREMNGGGCFSIYYYQLDNGREKSDLRRFDLGLTLELKIREGDTLKFILYGQHVGTSCRTPIIPLTNIADSKGDSLHKIQLTTSGDYEYNVKTTLNYFVKLKLKVVYTDILSISYQSPSVISVYVNTELKKVIYFNDISLKDSFTKCNLGAGDTIFIPISDRFLMVSNSNTRVDTSADLKMLKLVKNGNYTFTLKNGYGSYMLLVSNPSQEDFYLPCPNYVFAHAIDSSYYDHYRIPTLQSDNFPEFKTLQNLNVNISRFKDCVYQIDSLKTFKNIKWFYSASSPKNTTMIEDWDQKQSVLINKQGYYKCEFTDNDTSYKFTFFYNKFEQIERILDGVENFSAMNNNLKIVPNPVIDHFAIAENIVGDYSISDCLGHTVFKGSLVGLDQQIDVSTLQNGTYIFSISTPDKIYHQKFVK